MHRLHLLSNQIRFPIESGCKISHTPQKQDPDRLIGFPERLKKEADSSLKLLGLIQPFVIG
jgi:hypothetical protein